MDRNLALEFVRVTEAAAIAAYAWIGKGDNNAADGAAVDAMRTWFNEIPFSGKVVIGEGSKDEAPELYTGEKIGLGGAPYMDIAVDPLECTNSVAYGRYNATSVIAAGPRGTLLSAPDTYMDKIAVGRKAKKAINLDASVATNIKNVAKALGKKVSDVTVIILERDRHKSLIQEVRKAGARVRLISDGDVAAAIATCMPDSGIDLLLGVGGSTEAVLGGAAVKILGGEMYCRFKPTDAHHANLVKKAGFNTKKIYSTEDLAKGKELMFTATGIIDGPLLPGVLVTNDALITHSVVVRGETSTLRYVTTHHQR